MSSRIGTSNNNKYNPQSDDTKQSYIDKGLAIASAAHTGASTAKKVVKTAELVKKCVTGLGVAAKMVI